MRSFAREAEQNMARQDALLTDEPVRGFTRDNVMKELAELFRVCYGFGHPLNPLSGVRKCFPGLRWKFWEINKSASESEKSPIRTRIAEESDFVWQVGEYEFITAFCNSKPEDGGLLCHLYFFGPDGLRGIFRERFCDLLQTLCP